MSRDYQKEREWQLKKYDQIRANINKELGTKLREKLKEEDKSIASWITENARKYLENKEEIKMKEMIKELKEELLNKEVTLLDLDNTAERITDSSTSLFDYEEAFEQNSCAYFIKEDKNIVVEWEVIEDAEDKTEIKVKVTDIWED